MNFGKSVWTLIHWILISLFELWYNEHGYVCLNFDTMNFDKSLWTLNLNFYFRRQRRPIYRQVCLQAIIEKRLPAWLEDVESHAKDACFVTENNEEININRLNRD